MLLKRLPYMGLLISSLAFSLQQPLEMSVPRSLQVEIKKQQFEKLSEVITQEIKSQKHRIDFEEKDLSVKPFVKAELKNISVNASWESFSIKPGQNRFHLTIAPQYLNINAKTLELAPYFLPFMKTTCKGIKINLGGHQSFPIEATVETKLVGDQIKISPESLRIQLEQRQYEAMGPTHCTGFLGNEAPLTRFTINLFLLFSKDLVAKQIEAKAREAFPKIEAYINKLSHITIPFDFEEQFIFPETNVQFEFYPNKQYLSPEQFTLEMGMKIKPLSLEKQSTASYTLPDNMIPLASFGFNPQILTKLFAMMYTNPAPSWIINENLTKGIGSFLKIDGLSKVLPDLNSFPYAHPYARAVFKINKGPVFAEDQRNQSLLMMIDDIDVILQIKDKVKNDWMNYYHLSFSGVLEIRPTIIKQELTIHIASAIKNMRGHWDEHYQPQDNRFFKDGALGAVQELLDSHIDQISPIKGKIPPFKVGKKASIGIDNFRIQSPFIKIDLLGNASELMIF